MLTGPIVVVDDMEMALMVIKLILNKAGFDNVVTFDNPNDALEYVTKCDIPSFIVSDYNMPGINGIEFLDTITSFYPHVPTVIVSGDSQSVIAKSKKYQVIEKGGKEFFAQLLAVINDSLKSTAPEKNTTPMPQTTETMYKVSKPIHF